MLERSHYFKFGGMWMFTTVTIKAHLTLRQLHPIHNLRFLF